MTEHLVFHQLQQLPENLKQEVLDFIGYLLQKHQFQQQKPEKNKTGKGPNIKAEKSLVQPESYPSSVIQLLKDDLDIEEMMREQHWEGADKTGVFQAIRRMDVQEPVEELLSYLRA